MRKVIIDTDPGIDDAMAILMALRSPVIAASDPSTNIDALDVLGLTVVHGNVCVEQGARNALTILEVAGRPDIPVFAGAERPLSGSDPHFAHFVHGSDGLGESSQTVPIGSPSSVGAAEYLVKAAADSPGELTVLALGPLTNIAHALELGGQSFAANLHELVVMGGAFAVSGNVNPAAEANLRGDPLAADLVATSQMSIKWVGLDVTQQVVLQRGALQTLATKGTAGMWLASIVGTMLSFQQRQGVDGCFMHDQLACMCVMDSQLCRWRSTSVRVVTDGPASGHSLMVKRMYRGSQMCEPSFDQGQHGWQGLQPQQVATAVDVDRALDLAHELLSFDLDGGVAQIVHGKAKL